MRFDRLRPGSIRATDPRRLRGQSRCRCARRGACCRNPHPPARNGNGAVSAVSIRLAPHRSGSGPVRLGYHGCQFPERTGDAVYLRLIRRAPRGNLCPLSPRYAALWRHLRFRQRRSQSNRPFRYTSVTSRGHVKSSVVARYARRCATIWRIWTYTVVPPSTPGYGQEVVIFRRSGAANYAYIEEWTFRDDGTILARAGSTGPKLGGGGDP